jgi:hypothetical protein
MKCRQAAVWLALFRRNEAAERGRALQRYPEPYQRPALPRKIAFATHDGRSKMVIIAFILES